MPVLSILSCGMLEDEVLHILSNDPEIKQLFVVDNTNSLGFIKRLKSADLKPLVFPSEKLYSLVSESSNKHPSSVGTFLSKLPFFKQKYAAKGEKKKQQITIVVNLLKKDLHTDLDTLYSEICRNAREMASVSDGILIFYGKCGLNSTKVQDEFKELDCPVYNLRDENGYIANDCISVALGGNHVYTETMKMRDGKGAIYATPMWLDNMKGRKNRLGKAYNEIDKFLNNPEYEFLFKINGQYSNNDDFYRNASEFAKTYDMKIINIDGTMKVAVDSYMAAKADICKNAK